MSKRTKWDTVLTEKKIEKTPAYKRNIPYEDKVAKVKEVQAKYPHATRTTITHWTGYKSTLLNEMEAKGDIKLPPKRKMSSKRTSWMKDFLGGRTDG